jgi:hypothetical protein
MPMLSCFSVVDIVAGEPLSIAHNGDFDNDPQAANCECLKCQYYKDPAKFVHEIVFDSSKHCCSSLLYHLSQRLMPHDLFHDCLRLLATFLSCPVSVCSNCMGSADLGDAYHALGAALLESGNWQAAHRIWCLGYRQYPANAFLASTHEKLRCYDEVVCRNLGDKSDKPAHELVLPSNVSSDEFFGNFAGKRKAKKVVGLRKSNLQHSLFISKSAVVSPTDCEWVISTAEEYAARQEGWTTSRHYSVPTTDIPVQAAPQLGSWFNKLMTATISPMLCSQFSKIGQLCKISVHDAFVVKYDANYSSGDGKSKQRFLPLHMDQSTHSFVLALNSYDPEPGTGHNGSAQGYVGGGTYFADLGRAIRVPAGHMLSFHGDVLHGGDPVLRGCRYILAVFLYISCDNADGSLSSECDVGVPEFNIVSGCSCNKDVNEADLITALCPKFSTDEMGFNQNSAAADEPWHKKPNYPIDGNSGDSNPSQFSFSFDFTG